MNVILTNNIHRGFFIIIKSRKSKKPLTHFLHLFDFEDYFCYKGSDRFRIVTQKEFLEMKHSSYIFFEKVRFDKKEIEDWIEFLHGVCGVKFLVKPFPPAYIKNLIRIIK